MAVGRKTLEAAATDHPCDVVTAGSRLFIEPEGDTARPWRAVATHVHDGFIMLAVEGHVGSGEIPVGAWLKCHFVEGASPIEFRSLVVEVVEGAPTRMTMRPREATPRPDRRRHRRVATSAPARVLPEAGQGRVKLRATVEDISIGGLRFVWRGDLDHGAVFEVEIDLPTGAVSATALVVGTDASQAGRVVRAFFVMLDGTSKAAIRSLVASTPN